MILAPKVGDIVVVKVSGRVSRVTRTREYPMDWNTYYELDNTPYPVNMFRKKSLRKATDVEKVAYRLLGGI
jgi:hypothetical protein